MRSTAIGTSDLVTLSDPDRRQALLAYVAADDREALDELLIRDLPQLEAYLRLQAGAAIRGTEPPAARRGQRHARRSTF